MKLDIYTWGYNYETGTTNLFYYWLATITVHAHNDLELQRQRTQWFPYLPIEEAPHVYQNLDAELGSFRYWYCYVRRL